MKRTTITLIVTLFIAIFLLNCGTRKDIVYLQNISNNTEWLQAKEQRITLTPLDKISIVVSSKDPELSSIFNLAVAAYRIGTPGGQSSLNPNQQVSLYTVGPQGEIHFPILGEIQVGGLTREQTASKIQRELRERALIKDPIVTVEFANLGFSILGEVNRPGRQFVDRDKLTLLDAISMAGDLTIHGKRENILVIREEGDKRHFYRVDLRSPETLYSSPAYYIQQNDIIYVEPNSMRSRQSTVNGNSLISASFWMSLASLGTTITLFLLRR